MVTSTSLSRTLFGPDAIAWKHHNVRHTVQEEA
jgi:hypothetical protein